MRQLLRPRLVVLHLLVLLVVAVLARLGLWQLDRLDEAQARSDAVEERIAAAPVPVERLLDGLTTADTTALAALEYRRVTATGTWRPQDEVLQRGRSHAGGAGYHVLTPLDLDGGGTVLVRRGSVAFDNDLRPPVPDAAPPTGTVVVTGFLERSIPQPTSGVAQRDPDDGVLAIVFNADVDRLGPQLGGDVLPMLVHLSSQEPTPDATSPTVVPPPAIGNGPHLSYAIQWFSFATIGAGMYALWLRRRLRGDERAVSHAT